jgi:hypothetical protein
LMHYGLMADVDQNWRLRPAYHVMRLFDLTSRPGWRARAVESNNSDASACALADDHGAATIYLINPSPQPMTARIIGLPHGPIEYYRWKSDEPNRIARDQIKHLDDKNAQLLLPANAFVVLSTVRSEVDAE